VTASPAASSEKQPAASTGSMSDADAAKMAGTFYGPKAGPRPAITLRALRNIKRYKIVNKDETLFRIAWKITRVFLIFALIISLFFALAMSAVELLSGNFKMFLYDFIVTITIFVILFISLTYYVKSSEELY
jgi:hypothetical protein